MSQAGHVQAGGKAGGSYGPNNPPPPPALPAPNKTNRKRANGASSSPTHASRLTATTERPFKVLNSRQRKFRRLALAAQKEAEVDESQDRDLVHSPARKSRSPAREHQQGSRPKPSEPVSAALDKDGHGKRQTRSSARPKRQSLRDARQITPDQIIDETYGRLSPGTWTHDGPYEALDQTERQTLGRNDWPDEQALASYSSRDAQAGQVQQYKETNSRAHRHPDQYSQHHSPAPQINPMEPDWNEDKPERIAAPLPMPLPRQDMNFEDEVDWEDNAFDVPESVRTPGASDVRGPKPKQVPYEDRKHYMDTQSTPRRQSRGWDTERSPWQGSNQVPDVSKFSPQHGKWARQHPSPERFEKFPAGNANHPGYVPRLTDEEKFDARPDRDASYNPSAIEYTIPVPDTVYDVREYDRYITDMHKNLLPHLAYAHGNGKVAPYLYGALRQHDLGLCYATFATTGMCEMGVKCAWRHHPLTQTEREWILSSGREGGIVFIKRLPQYWANPEVPVPGANMHDKVRAR